ncbi:HNH endonuclease [Streptococcus ruminantium]|uniref:HNH endonuclease n=1 Tax=Streptococcus ruminantium TaxID=1917441 RepID=UPI0012DDA31A|nr:HNH endonuclease [Streptococcus ruminantium]
MIEAEQDIIYGSLGDTKSFAVNPIRDTIFLGNNQLYHQTGQIFSIGSSIIAPIGQTGSVVKGLAQFGGGALGAWGGGEVGYHGAKLLGASDSQVNAAKFLTSMAGASAGSSLAGKFSLNKLNTKTPNEIPHSTSTPPLDVLDEPVKVNTFDSWDDMKNAHKGTVTKFVQDNKPKGSPVVRDWFNKKNGTLTIEEFADGSQVWKYTNSDGITVPYSLKEVNGQMVHVVDFPEEVMYHGDRDLATVSIKQFTGDRALDRRLAVEEFAKQGIDDLTGYAIHHDYKNGILQLVDIDIHSQFSHYGGFYYLK